MSITVIEYSKSDPFLFDKFNSGSDEALNQILSYNLGDKYLQIGSTSTTTFYGKYIGSYWEYVPESLKWVSQGVGKNFQYTIAYGVSSSISVTESVSTEIACEPFSVGVKVTCTLATEQTMSKSKDQSFAQEDSITGPNYGAGFQQITVLYCPNTYYSKAQASGITFIMPGSTVGDYTMLGIRVKQPYSTTVPEGWAPEVTFSDVVSKLSKNLSKEWSTPSTDSLPFDKPIEIIFNLNQQFLSCNSNVSIQKLSDKSCIWVIETNQLPNIIGKTYKIASYFSNNNLNSFEQLEGYTVKSYIWGSDDNCGINNAPEGSNNSHWYVHLQNFNTASFENVNQGLYITNEGDTTRIISGKLQDGSPNFLWTLKTVTINPFGPGGGPVISI